MDSTVLEAVWRYHGLNAPGFELRWPSTPPAGASVMLDRLVLTGIEQYLDQRVHFSKQGVTVDVPVERMVADINGMVRAALAEVEVDGSFVGLSHGTIAQLRRVSRVDWSQATFSVDGGDDQDKYLAIYYYVRSQRQELERQLKVDLLPFATLELVPQGEERDPGRTVEVPTVCRTVFDDDNYLCALDLAMADTDKAVPDQQLTERLMANLAEKARAEAAAEPMKVRKRDRWLKAELDRINGRIDQIDQRKELWAIRDRIDAMEDRMNGLENDVEALRSGRGAGTSENPIAELSALTGRNIRIVFPKGGAALVQEHRMLLNEVFEQLARSPQDRVLITGYADRTGNADANMLLSERRAKAVQAYFIGRGIPADRLLLNHYGASRSDGPDADQRRVELEWLR